MKTEFSGSLPGEIIAYYDRGSEAPRLLRGGGRLEFARTQEIIQCRLPHPPAVVYDVGGGPGLYACWLAGLGYEVHLVDATPLHVEQTKAASRLQPDHPVTTCTVGDARCLEAPDASVDVFLLLGPLYHLTERADRVAALREARRVLKPGGVLFAAAISRYASALSGLREGALEDPAFVAIVEQDLINGQHRNPHSDRDYFTTAFFHMPSELEDEVEEAGFAETQLLAVESPGWLLLDLDERWEDARQREILLTVARSLEAEPSVIGVSSHFIAVATA